MTNRRRLCWPLMLASVLGCGVVGCGDDGGAKAGDDAAPPVDSAQPPDTGPTTDPWKSIISASWSLQPGQEKYVCASKTLSEDVYIGGYRPTAPPGTHHTLLTFGPATGPDDPASDCSPGAGDPSWIYASGLGTNALELPPGVGVKIAAGQQVHINLHLFNVSDAVLNGTSGVEILPRTAGEIVNEAEMFLPGPIPFSVPPGTGQQISGNCSLTADQHLVALFPHMHQLGKHLKAELVHADQTVTMLYDDDYSFDDQKFLLLDNLAASAGDTIRTTCTWDNTTGAPVPFGNSSTQEMCVSMMIRYPRLNAPGAQGAICRN